MDKATLPFQSSRLKGNHLNELAPAEVSAASLQRVPVTQLPSIDINGKLVTAYRANGVVPPISRPKS